MLFPSRVFQAYIAKTAASGPGLYSQCGHREQGYSHLVFWQQRFRSVPKTEESSP